VAVYTSYVALSIERYEASVLIPASQAGLVLAISIPAALAFGRTGAVLATITGVFLGAVGAIAWAEVRLRSKPAAVAPTLKSVLAFGIKGYSANALQLINYQVDLFILAAVASNAAVGHYALAVSIATLLLVLPSALATVLFPRIARLSSEGEESKRELVETKGLRHVSLLVFGGAVAIALGLGFLVVPVFGANYRPTTNLGLILLPGAAAMGLSSVLAATLIGRGKPVYSLYGALISTPITLTMYAVLIPWLHANGAALASTLSYLITFALFCRFYGRVTHRSALPLLVPTRSEFGDLRTLGGGVLGRPTKN
jgi:O-antigen/teichoic acid export membrane protein